MPTITKNILTEEIIKHQSKLKLHKSTKAILENELCNPELTKETKIRIKEKLSSTLQKLEYHRGAVMAYTRSLGLIEKELKYN